MNREGLHKADIELLKGERDEARAALEYLKGAVRYFINQVPGTRDNGLAELLARLEDGLAQVEESE